ncbi:CaiB/BaiF CoA transferase family protein [Chloroflexota bacterium]
MSSDDKLAQKRALKGLKVLDFGWAVTIPQATKTLADHGATVIRIETEKRLDVMRTHVPMVEGISGVNRCVAFAAVNTSKMAMKLDLNHPRGHEVVTKLVAWADVIVENFMAGTLERWGLDYEGIKKINPKIILVRASTFGQHGPLVKQPAFGVQLQALSGLTAVGGWPDLPPVGASVAYTDHIGPWYVILSIMSAVDYRRRTGRGQYIDLSQLEAAVNFLAPAVLDYSVNGTIQKANANRCDVAAPHNAFRCEGDDQWCAIAVFSDRDWRLCRSAMDDPEWARDQKYDTLAGRKRFEEELDAFMETWTMNYSPEEVMHKMQAVGVATGLVSDGKKMHEDPQLNHRHHFCEVDHAEMGVIKYSDACFRFSETPSQLGPPPCLGEHTAYVCTEILGMTDEEFLELLQEGVFT